MYKYKRIIVLVTDSVGIGEEPDADKYGDAGSHTLKHIADSTPDGLNVPTLESLGLGCLDDIKGIKFGLHNNSFVMKARETSVGKDTMTGHWEMMGVYTTKPFLTFTDHGFPETLIKELEERTGHKVIGNYAASGTEIIKQLGEQQIKENSLIVYTSADSVLQIAAHEEVTGLQELYRCCEIARDICMKPEWMVGRIIARPYLGTNSSNFKRTSNRHDLSLKPSVKTVMNVLEDNKFEVSCIGKISDIFDGYGVTRTQKTVSNVDGMNKTIEEIQNKDYEGLCYINLVEFDSEFGHRRNPQGYAKCLEEFDFKLAELLKVLKEDDLLIITADHGNDPTFKGTDHTREKVPVICYSKKICNGTELEERESFADIGATILKNFNLTKPDNLLGKPIEELL